MKRSLRTASHVTAAALAGALVMVALPAGAQDAPADEPTTTEAPERDAQPDGQRHRDHRRAHVARIAEALGMSVEDFRAAVVEVREMLDGQFDEDTPREEKVEAFKQAFSDVTGIAVEEIEAAHEELRAERLEALEERLEQAVEDGRITQEQADEILARAEAGEWRPRHHRDGGEGRPPVAGDGQAV